jgi:hypothetical protein
VPALTATGSPSAPKLDRRGPYQDNQNPPTRVPWSAVATVIAYVDGFNLCHGLHAKYQRRYLWLDLEQLARRIRPHKRRFAPAWSGKLA